MGLILQPSFSLSLAPASNPFTPPGDLNPPVFHHNPLQEQALSINRTLGKGGQDKTCMRLCVGVYVYVCLHIQYLCAWVNILRSDMCSYAHTANNMYLCTCMRVQSAIRWELFGGFPVRELDASNHMSRDGGYSGSRPGLGGNLQHMNRILGRGKEMKEPRGGGRKGRFPV